MSNRTTSAPAAGSATTQQQGGIQQQQGGTAIPHERIAMRAYEKWCQRGCPQGTEQQDWHEAETELRTEQQRRTATPAMTPRAPQPAQPQQRR